MDVGFKFFLVYFKFMLLVKTFYPRNVMSRHVNAGWLSVTAFLYLHSFKLVFASTHAYLLSKIALIFCSRTAVRVVYL